MQMSVYFIISLSTNIVYHQKRSVWYAVCTLTRNENDEKLNLYINGELKDFCSGYATGSKCEKFIFGGNLRNQWYAADMIVDNLRIYNTRALSDAEVEQIYKYESQWHRLFAIALLLLSCKLILPSIYPENHLSPCKCLFFTIILHNSPLFARFFALLFT